MTGGEEAEAPEPTSHSYETPDFSTSTEARRAISHSEVTDGSAETPPWRKPPQSRSPGFRINDSGAHWSL